MKRDWEFFSHGIYNTRYSYGLTPAQEQAVLDDSIRTVEAATGQRIRGYLAPAPTHTEDTLDLIAQNDFWYSCDLFQDDQPQPLKTKTGKLVSLPYSLEVNDVITYSVMGFDPERYRGSALITGQMRHRNDQSSSLSNSITSGKYCKALLLN